MLTREEWLAERRLCITSTDIAAICGLSRYRSAYNVWADKVGLAGEGKEPTPAMEWGTKLEPVIADHFSAQHPEIHLQKGEFVRDEWIGGTPDYISSCDFGLECKTAGSRMAGYWGAADDAIPTEYLCQIHWLALATRRSQWVCAVLIGGQEYREYSVNISQELCLLLKKKATSFWFTYVTTKRVPPLVALDNDHIVRMFPSANDSLISPDEQTDEMVKELLLLQSEIGEKETRVKELQVQIKSFIGEKKGILSDNYKVLWSNVKPRELIDWQAVVRDCNIKPELIAKHTKLSAPTRRFTASMIE